MTGSWEGLSRAPEKGPKYTERFPCGSEAAGGVEGTRVLEHTGLGSSLGSRTAHLVSNFISLILITTRALNIEHYYLAGTDLRVTSMNSV